MTAGAAGGSGSGGDESDSTPTPIIQAEQAMDDGDYQGAIKTLEQMRRKEPKNPDVLNLLGYGNRKLGKLDTALGFYQQALAIDPEHKGANEYLGELYLESDQLDKAEKRLTVLDKACFFPCEEYTELKEAIAAYKKKNGM